MDEQIEAAARAAHEVNRVFCMMIGDMSQPSWEDAPTWQRDSAIAGVEAIVRNPNLTAEQSHEGWLNHKLAEGWKYGPAKDPVTREHPCCVPYSQLPPDQRAKDEIFGAVVRGVLSKYQKIEIRCPECGPVTKTDEEGCCVSCGSALFHDEDGNLTIQSPEVYRALGFKGK